MQKFFKEEFQVPIDAMVEVSSVKCEHNLHHIILEVDEYEEIITMQLEYSKEEREVIHKIEDAIDDYSQSDDDDEEEEGDDE
ncbi:hypothetical protein [Paraflavitalea speifideaquila]|uniref:hypothetical protein n=1 Tax=Paraflavitalea speifideaquila TaxID=3076558 RepID=UPI0028E6C5F4|nr:hypothetical protein [Paraflavitalea speifideiaquila]